MDYVKDVPGIWGSKDGQSFRVDNERRSLRDRYWSRIDDPILCWRVYLRLEAARVLPRPADHDFAGQGPAWKSHQDRR